MRGNRGMENLPPPTMGPRKSQVRGHDILQTQTGVQRDAVGVVDVKGAPTILEEGEMKVQDCGEKWCEARAPKDARGMVTVLPPAEPPVEGTALMPAEVGEALVVRALKVGKGPKAQVPMFERAGLEALRSTEKLVAVAPHLLAATGVGAKVACGPEDLEAETPDLEATGDPSVGDSGTTMDDSVGGIFEDETETGGPQRGVAAAVEIGQGAVRIGLSLQGEEGEEARLLAQLRLLMEVLVKVRQAGRQLLAWAPGRSFCVARERRSFGARRWRRPDATT